jgi:DNA-binding beta-propeller fold protein YncE
MRSVLSAAALVIVAAAGGCGDPEAPAAEASPSSTSPSSSSAPAEPELAPHVQTERAPVGLAADPDGRVWVVAASGETAARFSADADEPDLVVDVPGTPLRAVAAYDALWVTSFAEGRLVKVDTSTGEVGGQVRVGDGAEGVAAGFGSVWVVAQDAGRLVRVDPATLRPQASIKIGTGARLVHVGPEAVYVSHFADDAVLRIDPKTNAITATASTCSGPQGLVVSDGLVWVACTTAGQVVALDADNLKESASVVVPGSPDPVAVLADGTIAVVAQAGPTLVTIDPGTAEILTSRTLGGRAEVALNDRANLDLVVIDGLAWVTSNFVDRLYRVTVA